MFLVDRLELPELIFLASENLNDVHARDVFLHKGVQVGHGIANVVEGNFDLFFKDVCTDQEKGNSGEAQQRQSPVLIEHKGENKDDLQKVAGHGGQAFAE